MKERKNTMATLLPRLEVRKDGKLHMPLYNKNNSKKVQAYEP